MDRQVEFRVAFLLVVLRLEAILVRLELLAEVLAVKRPLKLVRVEVAGVLAERAIEKSVVDRLDDRVQALELVVDVEAAEGLARGGLAHAREESHRDALVHHRSVLPEVLQHDRLQPEKLLAVDVAIEVDPQGELERVAAGASARSHAGVAHAEVAPLQVGGVVGACRSWSRRIRRSRELMVSRISCIVSGSKNSSWRLRAGRCGSGGRRRLAAARRAHEDVRRFMMSLTSRTGTGRCGSRSRLRWHGPCSGKSICRARGSPES